MCCADEGVSVADNASLMATCGAHPSTRVSLSFHQMQLFLVYLVSFYPCVITFNNDVKAKYWKGLVYLKLDKVAATFKSCVLQVMRINCSIVINGSVLT